MHCKMKFDISYYEEILHLKMFRVVLGKQQQTEKTLPTVQPFYKCQKITKLKQYISLTMKFANNCEWNLWRYPSYKTVSQERLRILKLVVLSWEHLERIHWSDAFLVTLSPLFVAVEETQAEYLFSRSCATSSSESVLKTFHKWLHPRLQQNSLSKPYIRFVLLSRIQ